MFALALACAIHATPPDEGDRYRFPPHHETKAAREFNQRYQAHLRDRMALEPHRAAALEAALAEARHLYACWDLADDLHCCTPCSRSRVDRLTRLRAAIGLESYYAGQMPPCVPRARFEELP